MSHTFVGVRHGLAQGFAHFDESLAKLDPRRAARTTTSPEVTARGLAWLDARAADDARWFLWLHYFDPHHVYREREGLTERFGGAASEMPEAKEPADPAARARWIEAYRTPARPLYDGEIAFTDRHLGRLFDGLAARALADDTIVVNGSDHGEEFYEHGERRHRWNLHEETLRVPLLVRAPGVAPRRVETPVSVVDVAPTVLELLCLDPPERVDGTSLVPALQGVPLERPPVVAQLRSLDRDLHEAIVAGDWKLLRTVEGGELRLYDLSADPREERDLAAEQPERVRELAARLDVRLEAAWRRAGLYGRVPEIRFTARERERLRALGYAEADD